MGPETELHLLIATDRPWLLEFFTNLGQHRQMCRSSITHVRVSADLLADYPDRLPMKTIALVDISSDIDAAICLCQELKSRQSSMPIVGLLCCPHSITHRHLQALIRAGITSLLDGRTMPEEVVHALHRVARGDAVLQLSSNLTGAWQSALSGQSSRNGIHPEQTLSETDVQLLEFVGCGLTDREIGQKLHLSPHTIKHQIDRLRRDIGVRNRIELAAWLGRHGYYRAAFEAGEPDLNGTRQLNGNSRRGLSIAIAH